MTWQPYRGLRVLDLSQGFAGPYCTAILASGGAEVIKVEPPNGDWARFMGVSHDGQSPMSMVGNVGKRAICIDASRVEGAAVLRRLASDCDLVVQSFRPGVAEKLGLGPADICEANPRSIYLSISGFGADGPYAKRAGSDSVMQAYTGMMVMNRDEQGKPRRIGMLAIDALTGSYAAHIVAAALYHRISTGEGGAHALSLLEVCAAFQAVPIVDDSLHGTTSQSVSVPAGTFRTADGQLNLVAIRDEMFFSICRVIGRQEWVDDPRMASSESRKQHRQEIELGIAEALARAPTSHWEARFREADVLCSVVNDYAAFRQDEQVLHARIFCPVEQPGLGTIPIARIPGFDVPPMGLAPSPALGQHTTQILQEYGYTAAEIQILLAQKLAVQHGNQQLQANS